MEKITKAIVSFMVILISTLIILTVTACDGGTERPEDLYRKYGLPDAAYNIEDIPYSNASGSGRACYFWLDGRKYYQVDVFHQRGVAWTGETE